MGKKKKKLKIVIVALAAVFVLTTVSAVLLIKSHFGSIATKIVRQKVPVMTGAPADLSDASFSLLNGELILKGFVLGNPPGYQTESSLKIALLKIRVNLRSLFKETIVVEEILIDGLEVTYEAGIPSNLAKIKENLSANKNKESSEQKEKKSSGKKIHIKRLEMVNSELRVGIKGLGGKTIGTKLPDMIITDIGKEEQKMTFTESFDMIFTAIFESAQKIAEDTSGLIKDGLREIKEGIKGLLN